MRSDIAMIRAIDRASMSDAAWEARGRQEARDLEHQRRMECAARRVLVRVDGLVDRDLVPYVLRLAAQLQQEGRGPVRAQVQGTRGRRRHALHQRGAAAHGE
jgi:hypothetical protein